MDLPPLLHAEEHIELRHVGKRACYLRGSQALVQGRATDPVMDARMVEIQPFCERPLERFQRRRREAVEALLAYGAEESFMLSSA
jgi:hypothetical protein